MEHFEVDKCKVTTEVGVDLCRCLQFGEHPKACIRNAINKSKKYIYIFGNSKAGKTTFWKKYYADPVAYNTYGKFTGFYDFGLRINTEEEFKKFLDNLEDEEGYRHSPLGKNFFTTHNPDIILGEKTPYVPRKDGIGILIERDPKMIQKKDEILNRTYEGGMSPRSIERIQKQNEYFRKEADESKNDIIYIRNKNGILSQREKTE